jgi:release factor glutamine methyltransferase
MKWDSVFSCIAHTSELLSAIYPEKTVATSHAWWLLEAVTKKNKAELLLQKSFTLSNNEYEQLKQLIHRHIHDHEPLSYLIGWVPFCSLAISVRPPILIARQETEEWCEYLIGLLKPVNREPLRILDMCTGSGCIGLGLAAALPNANVIAVDISTQALALAQENAKNNSIANIEFVQSNLFAQLDTAMRFDLIVSNPPYLSADEWQTLDPSVTLWEDKKALIAGESSTVLIEEIVQKAPHWLNQKSALIPHHIPQLVTEIGYAQGNEVKKIYEQAGFQATVMRDSHKKDRVVMGSYNYGKNI